MSQDYVHDVCEQCSDEIGAYEYAMVGVDDLNEFARALWRVVPVPPSQEITQGLTGPKAGPLTFLMERLAPVAGSLRLKDFNGYTPDTGGM